MTSIELAESAAARPHLHAVDPSEPDHGIDRTRAVAAVAELLTALGRDIRSPHLVETPGRVADALIELLTPRPFLATTFPGSRSSRASSSASPETCRCRSG